jgi:HD superfamily phosphodiesterase
MTDNGVDDLGSLPWFPPTQRELDLPDERLVPHIRDVTQGASMLAQTFIDRGYDISLDTVIAGALVHDVSKLYEFDGMDQTAVGRLLGHPHYGVHIVSQAGLPVEVAHIVLSHTRRTAIDPATIEAEIVRRADETAASAIRNRVSDTSLNI